MTEETKQPRRGIWWLASYPKSGNTWIRMLINAAVTGFPPNINAAFQYVSSDQLINLIQAMSSRPVQDMEDWELLYYRPASLMHQMHLYPQRDPCMKTHNANVVIGHTPLCPAELSKGAVYLVRDPRDVAVSFAKHVGQDVDSAIDLMSKDQAALTRTNKQTHYLQSWSAHVKSWLDERNLISCGCVKYEELRRDPHEVVPQVFQALGLGEHSQIMDRIPWAIEQCEISKLRQQESDSGFREASKHNSEFFGRGEVGGWRDVLTETQVERIEADHGEVMEELGYELTCREAVPV